MRRFIVLGILFAFFGIALVSVGCKKKGTSSTGGDSTPGPDSGGPGPIPKRNPKTGGIPLSQFPYDPTKPEIKIDLAKFTSSLGTNDPMIVDWLKKSGKLAEVYGVMGNLSVSLKTRRETYLVKGEFDGGAISCESLFPPDWRKEAPGRTVTVVGILEVTQPKSGGADIYLKDAHVMAQSGQPVAEVSAEKLGQDYAANAVEFEKKWKVKDRYYYVVGNLKRFDKIALSGSGVANKFILAGGKVDLYCNIQNQRGVEADPPKVGDTVTVLVEYYGYDGGFKAIAMSGVYVDKK
jgi:hypothetical protein